MATTYASRVGSEQQLPRRFGTKDLINAIEEKQRNGSQMIEVRVSAKSSGIVGRLRLDQIEKEVENVVLNGGRRQNLRSMTAFARHIPATEPVSSDR